MSPARTVHLVNGVVLALSKAEGRHSSESGRGLGSLYSLQKVPDADTIRNDRAGRRLGKKFCPMLCPRGSNCTLQSCHT